MQDKIHRIVLLCTLALIAGGCASSASISSWQHNVESYVAEKGDPNVLRDVTIRDNRRGFSVIGQADPQKSADATGVLLTHKEIEGRPWFVYLVGLVKEQKVSDIRLAAVTFEGKKAQWRVGAADAKATTLYRHYNEGLWHPSRPKEKPPVQYTTFPRESDTFDLKIDSHHLTATHPPSGAIWQLNLASAGR